MKKQILSLALIALVAFSVQSCGDKKEETKAEEELTLGNKVDSLTTDIEQAKDTAVTKVENAAEDVKDATKKAAEDVKDATKKAAEKAEAAAKAAKDGTVQTAKDVDAALKK
ncbi:hypothetical protein GON26_12920 [Flavobacterium sp. GA093]|uniref:Late embryogenesis abundant protein n=1 Tax=Flavobacterium hydrocarbonoxydans TaxID=2683249 RepID=A0A6I4NS05_9FLAO|nr:hypothetical protein [Flavobacterium hydrocarbonoxydans]MWB95265.1 hypothetical protein [Flavobacterium hydrocarbonoxydans]